MHHLRICSSSTAEAIVSRKPLKTLARQNKLKTNNSVVLLQVGEFGPDLRLGEFEVTVRVNAAGPTAGLNHRTTACLMGS